ncbi:MAG: NADH-quinone oxidoreductase subunit NuoF [Deltaproteobacteria bacterium]|nr:NADH-quinone oxidoreductase subunit NuoF [Deltaproteobacteria bacterium]
MELYRAHVLICAGGACLSSGAKEVEEALIKEISKCGLEKEIKVVETGCVGSCELGPLIIVYPEGVFYQKLTSQDIPEIVEQHLLKGRVVKRHLFIHPETREMIPSFRQIDFFRRQQKNVLRNCGAINPTVIEEYIGREGYGALAKVITSMSPEEVIEEILNSGLRGRGGAGFPTGLKWKFTRQGPGEEKFVVCNADEGDPGAFMDRSLLEGDPHSVLEGMAIASYSIGARQGYIYVRAEYPLAIERLGIAIGQARERGLLGEGILGTDFSFDIELRKGSGAFVCGEETALMISIEGKRGIPRPRPPFPAQQGLWAKPTLLNNVETYANIPLIILKGAQWYSSIGTERSKGTKIFALAGDINNTGLVEVPMGITLGEIVYDIGGGIPKGKRFKAAQSGGPSGGCIPKEHLNVPMDYESLQELGAIMGSGGLVVMDEDTCMVDVARFFMEFVQDESCGKCVPCREGTKRMLQILTDITQGKGREGDIELLEELGMRIKDSALCGLGQTAPNPVLSTIRYFRDEYEAHIKHKKCPAVVCSALFKAPCQHACPIEQDVPGYLALIAAGRFDDALALIRQKNPFPGVCGRVCTHYCESKCRRGQLDEPIAISQLKRFPADFQRKRRIQTVTLISESREEKVAVIGSGPGGLTAAHDLAKRGYNVAVFEELPVAGGMMAVGIPDYRLPKDVLAAEINMIERLGVTIRTNTRVGRDISFDDLRKNYDAIFIAVGCHVSLGLGVEGEDLHGVYGGAEFLRGINLGERLPVGGRVVVVGGGNAAIDAARTSVRLGAEDVVILYRRQREDMPASDEEIEEALEEGVQVRFLVVPKRIVGRDGKVAAMECQNMGLGEFDRSGRRRPVPIEGSGFTVDADTVIAAIGQVANLSFLDGIREQIAPGGRIDIDSESYQTSLEGVFAGGDVVTGPWDVVNAIAAGHRAAEEIDRYLRLKKGEPPWREEMAKFEIPIEIEEEVVERPRVKMPMLSPEERKVNFQEVELGYAERMAMEEARRCLRCDLEID